MDTYPPEGSSAPRRHDLPAAAARHLRAGAAVVWAPYASSTWAVGDREDPRGYLKAGWVGAHPTIAGEVARARWLAGAGVAVPEVVDAGADERVEWMLTAPLRGVPAVAPQHLADPRGTVAAMAEGLRALHEVDASGCPFDWTLPVAVEHVRRRVEGGEVDPAGLAREHRHLSPARALEHLLSLLPEDEDLVVTHGDWCFPNVFLEHGRTVGLLDLGEVGVADRWRDLAIGTWTTVWNVGPGYEELFLEAYGADGDLRRRDCYRLLYDLES